MGLKIESESFTHAVAFNEPMYSDYRPIDVAFINGYLAPLALLKDYVTLEVGFTYFFRELSPAEGGPLIETVRDEIRKTIVAFHKANCRELDIGRIDRILASDCRLDPVDDWHSNIKARLSSWISQGLIERLEEDAPGHVWPPSLLVDDFTKVLIAFLGDSTKCYTLGGDITSELYIQWGGLSFDDFFFEDSGHQYHLHFDLCD